MSTMPFSRGLITCKLFPASGQEELKARLAYLVRERGIGLITGEIGSGKSTALRAFVDSLDPTRYTVVYTANPLIGISGFYREVLSQLGEPVPLFRQQMVLAIRRCFDTLTNERKKTPVVIVDEAHLVDQRMLEELRLLLNVRMDSQAGCSARPGRPHRATKDPSALDPRGTLAENLPSGSTCARWISPRRAPTSAIRSTSPATAARRSSATGSSRRLTTTRKASRARSTWSAHTP